MSTPQERSEVHELDLESLLSHAHRGRDLLTGAKASLVGVRELGAATACNLVLEARAQLDGIVSALEAMAAVRHEAERAERAHRAESARVHTALPGKVLP